MEIDYEVTKAFVYRKYWNSQWSYDDFEDRYHDAWEAYLRYGVPDGVVPLTAFCTMFRTQYSKRLEHKMHTILSDEEREAVDSGYELDTDLCLLQCFMKKLKLTDQDKAVVKLKLSGLTNLEAGTALKVSASRVEEIWRTKILTPISLGERNGEYRKQVSLAEGKAAMKVMRAKRLAK